MSLADDILSTAKPASDSQARVCRSGDWTLIEHSVCTSTNLVAAHLPAWSAVRADVQTKGRGRFDRSWVSDAGGLWLSAVLPVRHKSPAWRFLPVAIGLAVCQTLGRLGASNLRLRWPNDVLVGQRKLAGLLLDQFSPELVVAGIGINVANDPESREGSLTGQTIRLRDLIPQTPTLTELAFQLLTTMQRVSKELDSEGPESLVPVVNALWQAPRPVRLDLDGREILGEFVGVDAQGRLELRQSGHRPRFFEPQQVRCLRETDSSDS